MIPLMLLQMVIELDLVQLLDPQRPTAVCQDTPCKERTEVPAWPMDSGVGSVFVAVVSLFARQADYSCLHTFGLMLSVLEMC